MNEWPEPERHHPILSYIILCWIWPYCIWCIWVKYWRWENDTALSRGVTQLQPHTVQHCQACLVRAASYTVGSSHQLLVPEFAQGQGFKKVQVPGLAPEYAAELWTTMYLLGHCTLISGSAELFAVPGPVWFGATGVQQSCSPPLELSSSFC